MRAWAGPVFLLGLCGWGGDAVFALDGSATVGEGAAGEIGEAGYAFEGHGALGALVECGGEADGVAVWGTLWIARAGFFGRAHVCTHRAGVWAAGASGRWCGPAFEML